MGQSTSIYRISTESFEKLKASNDEQKFETSLAKSDICLMGSFMGLEYILAKGQDAAAAAALKEIFTPQQVLGGEALEGLTPEELVDFYDEVSLIPYLEPAKISEINLLLGHITKDDIHANYNAEELNENGIYPAVWHNDNSPDQAYNERHLQEDFEALKEIFRQATKENDYLLVFAG